MNDISKTKRMIPQPRIQTAPIHIGKEFLTIRLPKSVLQQTNFGGEVAYFTVTNGVVQISGQIPNVVIPALTLNASAFMPKQG